MFYNYAYLDPRKPSKFTYPGLHISFLYEPYYIGKGKNNRYKHHISDFLKDSYKTNKIKRISVEYNPLDFVILFNHTPDENLCFRTEEYTCRCVGIYANHAVPLTNESYGGVGGKGRVVSETECINRSENHYMKNKTYTEIYGVEKAAEIQNKRSATMTNHPCYQDVWRRQRASDKRKGKTSVFDVRNNTSYKVDVSNFISDKYLFYPTFVKSICVELNSHLTMYRSVAHMMTDLDISETLARKLIKDTTYRVAKNSKRLELKGINIFFER